MTKCKCNVNVPKAANDTTYANGETGPNDTSYANGENGPNERDKSYISINAISMH